jgi:hypothetical protein
MGKSFRVTATKSVAVVLLVDTEDDTATEEDVARWVNEGIATVFDEDEDPGNGLSYTVNGVDDMGMDS